MIRAREFGGFHLGPTGFLIVANILMFIVTVIRPELVKPELVMSARDGLEVRSTLALVPGTFMERPWTLLTSMFVHASVWHIFANMFSLYFFGRLVHRLIGEGKFLIIYFLGGLLGGVFYVLMASSYSYAVGASGAVFAVAGVLTVLRPKLAVFIIPIPVPIPLWVAVIGGFLLLSLLSLWYGIAWQAHLGGLVFGLMIAYIFLR